MLLKMVSSALMCGLAFAVLLPAGQAECLDIRCFVTDPGDISPWPATPEQANVVPRESALAFLVHSGIRSVSDAHAVQEYRFASLQTGKTHLLAVVEGGGTVGAVPIELADVLVSVRGDGVSQLLTLSIVGMLDSGLHELGYWQLYVLGLRGPALVTGKYRTWLHARLQQRETEAVRTASSARERETIRAEAAFAAAYLNDKLGVTRDALFACALTWSHADAEEIRKLVALARDEAPHARAQQQFLQHWETTRTRTPQPQRLSQRSTHR